MYIFSVNFVGVLLALIAAMIIGMLWYSPLLFGKKWMKLVGMSDANLTPEQKKEGNKAMTWSLIPTAIMAYILAVFMHNLLVISVGQALLVGFLAWVGFVATVMSTDFIFSVPKKSWTLYYITSGYQLVSLLAMAAILFWFK